jgi:ubiquinone/menaquinone biosynthesis C-methylase UbiE
MRISLHRHDGHLHRHHGDDANPFQGRAAHYDWLVGHLMRRAYRRIAADAVATLHPQASVLDVGTGPGRLLVEIALMRPDLRVTGVDLASDMIDAARRNLAGLADRAVAVVGDVCDLPFEDDTFDLIVSTLSLHHWAEPAGGGAELARVLRGGGQIRIYDIGSAPFAALHTGVTGHQGAVRPARFPITPLPRPALRRLVLQA